ncbi:MAG: hypothetical protein R3Y38_06345 [Rikenellaceae bacterium]
MEALKNALVIIVVFVVVFFSGWLLRPLPENVTMHEIRYDTLRIFTPRCDTVYNFDTVIRVLPGVLVRDTVRVYVPLKRYDFAKEGVYKASVTGYDVTLQSIEVYPKTVTVTKTITERKLFTHGLQLGVGAVCGTKGLDLGIYVGYGFSVNF